MRGAKKVRFVLIVDETAGKCKIFLPHNAIFILQPPKTTHNIKKTHDKKKAHGILPWASR